MEKDDEQRIYDEVYSYLTASRYRVANFVVDPAVVTYHHGKLQEPALVAPCGQGATKVDKATIRKRSKKFEVVDGILHYKEEKGNSMNLRQVSSTNRFYELSTL